MSTIAPPDIVYLNRCAAGCTVKFGGDDAINGFSSLVPGTTALAAFPHSDAVFDATAACVRTVLAPYNIQVRIADPGTLPRREIMLSTTSQQIGLPSGIAADAPLDGHPHDNAIAFVFATVAGPSVDNLCWDAAQTIGNLYGLDIVTYCPDIMSYSTGCGTKSFTTQNATCLGTVSGVAGVCALGNTAQNSAAVLITAPGPTDILFENGVENFQVPASGPSP